MNDKLISKLNKEIINSFIRIFSDQNEEEVKLFDNGDLYKSINIASLEKIDRTVNNKDFKFKFDSNDKYAVFLSLKTNEIYGNKRTIQKIKDKQLKINIDKKKNDLYKTNNKNVQSKLSFESYTDIYRINKGKISINNNLSKENLTNNTNDVNLNNTTNIKEIPNKVENRNEKTPSEESNNKINNININSDTSKKNDKSCDGDISIVNIEFQRNSSDKSKIINTPNKQDDIIQLSAEENNSENINLSNNFNNKIIIADKEVFFEKINFCEKNESKSIFENKEFFLTSKIYDFNELKLEEKNLQKKFFSDNNILYLNNSNNLTNNENTFNNITDYILNYKKDLDRNPENELFILPDEILNFECDKYIYYLNFIKITSSEYSINNLIEKLKDVENINSFIETLNKINSIDDLKRLELEIFYEDLKQILTDGLKIKIRLFLNRETTFLNHTNKDSFRYFYTKNIKIIKDDIFNFERILEDIPIIDIEIRRYDKNQKVIEDGVLFVLFLICDNITNLIEFFSKIKYEVYYSKYALTNYISKYVYDLVFEYTHISDNLLDFFKNFGSVNTYEFIKNDKINIKNLIKDNKINLENDIEREYLNYDTFCDKENKEINNDNYKIQSNNYPSTNNIINNTILSNKNCSYQNSIETEVNVNCLNNKEISFADKRTSNFNVNNYINIGNDKDSDKMIDKLDRKECNNNIFSSGKNTSLKSNKLSIDEKKENSYEEEIMEIDYPFKIIIRDLEELLSLNLIQYLNKNISSIRFNNNLNTIPYAKFLKLLLKFNSNSMNEDGIRMKHTYLKKQEFSKFRKFKPFLIFDKQDKINKDHKINVNKLINYFLKEIESKIILNSESKIFNLNHNENISDNNLIDKDQKISNDEICKSITINHNIKLHKENDLVNFNLKNTFSNNKPIKINDSTNKFDTNSESNFTINSNNNINNSSNWLIIIFLHFKLILN